jgi:hypothetical protein
MSEAATRQVMQRYFEALGTSGLEEVAAPGRPDERIPFCVIYEVRGDRVCAMRAYGSIESAVLPGP